MRLNSTAQWTNGAIELFVLKPEHVSEAYVAWLNDPTINRYLECRFTAHTLESTRRFVENCLNDPATLFLGIKSHKHELQHIGNIKLGPIDRSHGRGEVGILIGEQAAWGNGIATVAVEMLTTIARDELGLRKLTAGCYVSNVGSVTVFLRAGFEIEGKRKAHFLLDGNPEASVLMGRILA